MGVKIVENALTWCAVLIGSLLINISEAFTCACWAFSRFVIYNNVRELLSLFKKAQEAYETTLKESLEGIPLSKKEFYVNEHRLH